MASVAALYNVPNTDEQMWTWSWQHMAHHRDINDAIARLTGTQLPEYILDPVNLADPGVFLAQHQEMHNNTDAILGISGYDLTEVDWSDEAQRAGWIELNAQLHVAEADALGTN